MTGWRGSMGERGVVGRGRVGSGGGVEGLRRKERERKQRSKKASAFWLVRSQSAVQKVATSHGLCWLMTTCLFSERGLNGGGKGGREMAELMTMARVLLSKERRKGGKTRGKEKERKGKRKERKEKKKKLPDHWPTRE